jgi:protease I
MDSQTSRRGSKRMAVFDNDQNNKPLQGKRIAILATEGVEEVELTKPKQALEDAGASVDVIAPESGMKLGVIKAWDMTDWGKKIDVDVKLADADPNHYDALHLPGGVMNPDNLRMLPAAVEFVKSFFTAGKPVSAICHASWTLIETGSVKGKTMTSWPSLRTDLLNAGAHWVDKEVVVDNKFVTSRKPEDLPAFNKQIIETFAAG